MRVVVTGGAGYIGSHVARLVLARGHDVGVIDNLSTGVRKFVPPEASLLHANLTDFFSVGDFFQAFQPDVVVHLAGFKFAGESVVDPLRAYHQNIEGTRVLLEVMKTSGTRNLIFSSSSSVYGEATTPVIDEDHPKDPLSPYGESKLVCEWMINASALAYGWKVSSLRYFNVIGSAYPDLYDTSPHGLLSRVFQSLQEGSQPTIFGDDYPTPDGTCVRDYISVKNLAETHVVAAERLESGQALSVAYNLGTGVGRSVAEMLHIVAEVTGYGLKPIIGPRRPGDPAVVVASAERASRELGWDPDADLVEVVATAWEAYKARDHVPPAGQSSESRR